MHDDKADLVRYTGDELRDIHRRIDSLKEENERQFNSLTGKLHDLEVTLARGNRFPAAAYVAAIAVVVTVIGHGAVLYSELQTAKTQATTSFELMNEHVKGIGTRQAQWSVLDEKLRQLESKVVGRTEQGWHRADHDQYAATVKAQHEAFDLRLKALENNERNKR